MCGVSQSLLGLGVDAVRSGEKARRAQSIEVLSIEVLRPKGPGLARCRGKVFGEEQSVPSPPARGSGERCNLLQRN